MCFSGTHIFNVWRYVKHFRLQSSALNMPHCSVLDSYFEGALIKDSSCMQYISIPASLKLIPIVSWKLGWGSRIEKPQNISVITDKKWAVTNWKCVNEFGRSTRGHKYCYIVRVSNLLADWEFMSDNLLAGMRLCISLWPRSSILMLLKAELTSY